MKNILVIQGGGRHNGNTEQLIDHFVKGVTEAGHLAEIISLMKNEVKGCLGCNACRYQKPCVQKDAFIERFYCIAEEDKTPHLEEAYEFGKNIYSE